MTAIVLHIPIPPPLAACFTNVPKRGRVTTERYRVWKNAAGWAVKAAKQKPITGPVTVTYAIKPRKGSDIDNRAKAVLDLLTEHKLIEDDSYPTVREVIGRWDESQKECLVFVYPAVRAGRKAA